MLFIRSNRLPYGGLQHVLSEVLKAVFPYLELAAGTVNSRLVSIMSVSL